jgi:hypothetical protein
MMPGVASATTKTAPPTPAVGEPQFLPPGLPYPTTEPAAAALRASPASGQLLVTEDMLMPHGQRYAALVPDTLDLAERARLAVHGLTSSLNERGDYSPYQHVMLNTYPAALLTNVWGPRPHNPNWGKIAEATVLARQMCGSEENLHFQRLSFNGMLASQFTRPTDWGTAVPAAVIGMAVMALEAQVRSAGNRDALRRWLGDLATALPPLATVEGDMAYFYDGPPDLSVTYSGVPGHVWNTFVPGKIMWMLARHQTQYQGRDDVAELIRRMRNYLLWSQKLWVPETSIKAVHHADSAHFSGHIHGYTTALMGLSWYGIVAGDDRILQFVRDGYEYVRLFGLKRTGMFGEICQTSDMLFLAIRLSQLGIGDYWDDADHYIRNQLAENQLTDVDKVRGAWAAAPQYTLPEQTVYHAPIWPGDDPPPPRELIPDNESMDNVIERTLGLFLDSSSWASWIPKSSFMSTICGPGNGCKSLYYGWSSIVEYDNQQAQINLLLNRASPWLDIDSHLPYEGKVVIRNKQARRISVRVPGWVDTARVDAVVDGRPHPLSWSGRYLVFDKVKADAVITVRFPVPETQESYTVHWHRDAFLWMESNNPGPSWIPQANEVTIQFKGSTAIGISPGTDGGEYAYYQGSHYRATRAPMKRVTRFVAPVEVNW